MAAVPRHPGEAPVEGARSCIAPPPRPAGGSHRERAQRAGVLRPDRFGSFATLPLPDVDGALAEVEYALGTLHGDGVVLMASYAGRYLGDPVFDPLWAELDRRQAVVFEHPGATPGQPLPPPAAGVAPPMADFPFETTRTGVQLVLNGVVDRYPGVRVILSHAGGFLAYASLRFAELARIFNPDAASPDVILASFRRFYFDTALASGPALPTLMAFAGRSRILFGTDSPYEHGVSAAFTAALDADSSLTATTRRRSATATRRPYSRVLPSATATTGRRDG